MLTRASTRPARPRALTGGLPLLLLAAALLAPARAAAAPQRLWGLGTASGGGFVLGTHASAATKLPSVALALHFHSGHALELELPLSNIVATSVLAEGFCFASSATFAFNIGRDALRLRLGPGVGLDLLFTAGGTGAEVRLPALLALELLSPRRELGLRVGLRPWVGLTVGSGSDRSTATFGSLLEVGVFWYATR